MAIVAMMNGTGGSMGGWMALWGLLGLAVIVLTVVATSWLVKHVSNGGSGSDEQRLLERRYAAGDIDREEFLQRRDDLARRR